MHKDSMLIFSGHGTNEIYFVFNTANRPLHTWLK